VAFQQISDCHLSTSIKQNNICQALGATFAFLRGRFSQNEQQGTTQQVTQGFKFIQ
jgi:hypothetical protein